MRVLSAVSVLILFSSCNRQAAPGVDEARKFLEDAETRLLALANEAGRAQWVQSNFITQDTEALSALANERLINATVELAKQAGRYDGVALPAEMARKMKLLKVSLTLPAPADPKESAETARLAAGLEAAYGRGKYCTAADPSKCFNIDDVTKIMVVENSKGEWGLGQHEVNVRYSDILSMADNHALFKQCVKEVAEQAGISVTFMAKPAQGQAGSGCHLHLSLRKRGRNAFKGTRPVGPVQGSDVFRWFLGGWIAHAAEFMVFYAPTVNSYKRFEDLSWAPTRLAWSYDNRTAGFRVVGHGDSLRIECRIPGADVNPYLAFAAALASGLDGIAGKTEPPPAFEGDVYAARSLPRVPYTLEHAVDLFESSPFVKATLGAAVAGHYTHFYRNEQKSFERAVTGWERRRYFERI